MRIVLLSGLPGVGTTTMVRRIADSLVASGIKLAGVTTNEVRENDLRTGFRITNLSTGEEGWLARKDVKGGPRIGAYHVMIEDLERIGIQALETVSDPRTDFAIVDEVGPMEMASASFRSSLVKVFHSGKPILATVKFGSRYSEIEKIRDKCLQLVLTSENREQTYANPTGQVATWVGHKGIES